jgi:hypothetical protein
MDPHSLVESASGGALVLGPLVFSVPKSTDTRETVHTDCALSFAQGVVLEVMSTPAFSNARATDPEPTASPFGLWVVQPISAAMPQLACSDDGFKSAWPPAAQVATFSAASVGE